MQRKRLKEIFTATVVSVSPATSVSQAIGIMGRKNISCIVILEENKPIGIFTERNVVRFTAQRGPAFDDCEIRELMSSPVLTADKDTDIYTAFNLLETNNIRRLVVVDHDNRVAGVVTQSDVIEHLGVEYFVELKKASQIMTRVLSTISKDITVYQALTEMANKSISCLIVVQHDRPVGILTERDVGKLLVDYGDISQLKVEEVMSSPARTASPDTSVHEVAKIMQRENIRRVVVIDKAGKTLGLITQSDIIKGLEAKYIEILKQLIREKDVEIQRTLRDLSDKTVYLDNILHSSIDMGIVATDLNFRVAYYNPGAEQILGSPAEEVIGRDAREIDLQKNAGLPRFDRVVETIPKNKSHTFTFEQDTEGGKRFIHARVAGIWDKEQTLVGFVLMLRDITERKEAEAALRAAHGELEQRVEARTSQLLKRNEQLKLEIKHRKRAEDALRKSGERFRSFLDNLGDVAYEVDSNGIITYANKMAEKMTGLSLEDLLGKHFIPLFTEESQKVAADAFERTLDGESAEYELTFTNGTIGDFRNEPLRDENHKVVGLFGIARDVTEHRKAREALRESREKYRILVENSSLGVSMIEKDGRYKYINPKFIQMFGYTLEEIPTGREWFAKSYPDPEKRNQVISTWIADLEKSKIGEVRGRTFTVTCKDGSEKVIYFRPVTLVDSHIELTAIC